MSTVKATFTFEGDDNAVSRGWEFVSVIEFEKEEK